MPQTPSQTAPPTGIDLAIAAARLADEKQAENILVIDLRGLSTIADFFVLCSANSPPHLNAIRREVGDRLKVERGVATYGSEGNSESLWAVLDFVDVVVHILHEEKRHFYALEALWSDAPFVQWQEEDEPRPAEPAPAPKKAAKKAAAKKTPAKKTPARKAASPKKARKPQAGEK